MFRAIKKRNGQTTPFKIEKIVNAIYKASTAVSVSIISLLLFNVVSAQISGVIEGDR